jgi:hypothetical protein
MSAPKQYKARLSEKAYVHMEKVRGDRSQSEFLDKAVSERVKLEQENTELKLEIEKLTQTQAPLPQIQSDVRPGTPTETNPEKQALMQRLKEEASTPPPAPPCPFCAKITKTEIECGKELSRGKKPLQMSTPSCIACWERREYVKKKQERQREQQEKQPEPEPQHQEQTFELAKQKGFKSFMEKLLDGTLLYRCAYERGIQLMMKDLRCIKDPDLHCQFKDCEKELMKQISLTENEPMPRGEIGEPFGEAFHLPTCLSAETKREETEAEIADTRRRLVATQKKFDATKEKLSKMSPEEYAAWLPKTII